MVRTSDSKSENQGSIPCRGAFFIISLNKKSKVTFVIFILCFMELVKLMIYLDSFIIRVVFLQKSKK